MDWLKSASIAERPKTNVPHCARSFSDVSWKKINMYFYLTVQNPRSNKWFKCKKKSFKKPAVTPTLCKLDFIHAFKQLKLHYFLQKVFEWMTVLQLGSKKTRKRLNIFGFERSPRSLSVRPTHYALNL